MRSYGINIFKHWHFPSKNPGGTFINSFYETLFYLFNLRLNTLYFLLSNRRRFTKFVKVRYLERRKRGFKQIAWTQDRGDNKYS